MYNSNQNFDYGSFRILENMILNAGTIGFDKFAYIFDQSGNFVFESSTNSADTVIVHVALEGTSCGDTYRIQPQSELSLRRSGVSPTTRLNLTPDWKIILTIIFTIILLILGLLVFSAIWSRQDRTLSPWQNWKPKYLAVDLPYILPQLSAKNIKHNLADEEVANDECGNVEEMTSKELYDRLEDQNLQIASQMQQHQSQLQEYFANMSKEADKLQQLIDKVQNADGTNQTTPESSHLTSQTTSKTTIPSATTADISGRVGNF